MPYQNTNTKPSYNLCDCMIILLAKAYFCDIQTWFGSCTLDPIGCGHMSKIGYILISC